MEAGESASLTTEVKQSGEMEDSDISQKVSKLEVDEIKSSAEEISDKNGPKLVEDKSDNDNESEEGEVVSDKDESKPDPNGSMNEVKDDNDKPDKEDIKLDENVASSKTPGDVINGECDTTIDINTGPEESDGEIVDSDVDDGQNPNPQVDYSAIDDVVRPELDQLDYDEDVDEGELRDESEDLKKSAPDASKADKEMSEGEIESSDGEIKSDAEEKGDDSKQKLNTEDYEEGEMVDPDGPSAPREICRFFERGNCTWGDRCRFLHPGINDKGGYDMFGSEKQAPLHPLHSNHFPPHMHPPGFPMHPNLPPGMLRSPPVPETAWERGLRHAKEMRRRAMQRKVEEPDFMRKREVISLNEALNVDHDLDYIAQKPLVEEDRGFDPFNALDEDDRYAVPPPEEIKRFKRFEKIPHHRDDGRSPNEKMARRLGSPPHGPPGYTMSREMHDRGRDRRSPPRHPGLPPHPHDRHQPPPMPHRDHRLPPHQGALHPRQEYRDHRDANGDRARHERDYRDRRMEEMKDRDYRSEHARNVPPDDRRGSPRRRDGGTRIGPTSNNAHKKSHSARGDTWSDPWARGRPSEKGRGSRSGSDSSGSSSSSSRSSFSSDSGSSFSSRSSSRSSLSSSYSSSGSSRSPSPKKSTKKLTKKKNVAGKVVQKGPAPKATSKVGKVAAAKPSGGIKKTADIVKAKLTKPPPLKQPVKQIPPMLPKPSAKGKPPPRGRSTVKAPDKKARMKSRKSDSSSSSEFSHSSSSESRSRSRSKGKASGSDSDSGSSSSSSGSESFSSSSGSSSSDSSNEDTKKRKPTKKKIMTIKPTLPPGSDKKTVGKVPVPSKPGKKNVRMTIIDKAPTKPAAASDNRKRPAGASAGPPAKKVSAIANRRVELLEQLKVVENAILKKRAKLT